jgi:hypothetical protein
MITELENLLSISQERYECVKPDAINSCLQEALQEAVKRKIMVQGQTVCEALSEKTHYKKRVGGVASGFGNEIKSHLKCHSVI